MPAFCSEVLKNLEEFVCNDESLSSVDDVNGVGSSLFSGALSMALCYIRRVFRSGPLHPQPRILCLHGSPDGPEQYVAVMNSIFSAQRSMVPIDSCVIGAQRSAFLQQASYITGGVYLKPPDGLFQNLSTVFATDLHSRKFIQLPKPVGVDFRASCFCHKNTIDMGYICSVCLSIFCMHHKKCSTCGEYLSCQLNSGLDQFEQGTAMKHMKDTYTGEKFTLFYVSNDEAIRLVQSSSEFAAKVLFPNDNSMPEKLIDQVEVQLVRRNLTNDHTVDVKSFGQKRKYILSINSLVMELGGFKYRIRKGIQRGMAEILLFNQRHRAPLTLLDGMVEYISDLAGFGGPMPVLKLRGSSEKYWEDKDPRVVATFLAYCKAKSKGCVGRLNQEMNRDCLYEQKMDKVLGLSAIHLCVEFHDLMFQNEDMIS